MDGVGFPARIIPAYFSDRTFGPLNSILPFAAIAGVALYSWAAVDGVTGVWFFAIVYGALAAGIQGLFPAVLTGLTRDRKSILTPRCFVLVCFDIFFKSEALSRMLADQLLHYPLLFLTRSILHRLR